MSKNNIRIIMGANHRIIRIWVEGPKIEYVVKDPFLNNQKDKYIYSYTNGKFVGMSKY